MPYLPDDDEKWRDVQRRVHDALEQFAPDFGPRACEHGDHFDCDEDCRYGDTQPKPGSMPMIKDWVLVITTEDVASDSPVIQVVQAPNQRGHATTGLLHTALYE